MPKYWEVVSCKMCAHRVRKIKVTDPDVSQAQRLLLSGWFFVLYCPVAGRCRISRELTGRAVLEERDRAEGESPLLLWLHSPLRNRDELTPAGFCLPLGGYYSFVPGTCWIQWGCLNSALRPKRARAEPGQSLAHFPHRSSAMWRWGRLNKAALKQQICPPFPGMQLAPVPSSAGSRLGRERSGSASVSDADTHTQTHTCACRHAHGHTDTQRGYSAQPEQSLPGGSPAPAALRPLLPPRWRWPRPPPLLSSPLLSPPPPPGPPGPDTESVTAAAPFISAAPAPPRPDGGGREGGRERC